MKAPEQIRCRCTKPPREGRGTLKRAFSILLQSLGSCTLTVVASMGAADSIADARPPNVLVILADDLGFSDLGCYGGEIATPNLDALAVGGLRFTQFYNTSRCWPTRAALLTGYYPQQVRRDGMPGMPARSYGEGGGVRPEWAKLLPVLLRPAGYRSYHIGKWHIDGDPVGGGFDATSSIGKSADGNHQTVPMVDHAIKFLEDHAARHARQPFFQYLAFTAPHFPLRASPEDIDRYRDRYLAGWEQVRIERHRRLLEMGVTRAALSALESDVGPPYHFSDDVVALGPDEVTRPLPWTALTAAQQRFQATKMAIHAAMIDRMDREIGRLLAQLRRMAAYEDTLILFLSDNGASSEIMIGRNHHDPAAPMGSGGSFLCLGPGFSSAANTPFRRHKTWLHEGGIATPLVMHWPAGIAARDELRTTVAHVIDVVPTILELAGVPGPRLPGRPVLPGRSLVPVFAGDGGPLHDTVWFYHEGNWALRQGDWKIVHEVALRVFPWPPSREAAAEGSVTPKWALYNLADDRAEQHDLAARYPGRVESMAAQWIAQRDQFIRDSTGSTPARTP